LGIGGPSSATHEFNLDHRLCDLLYEWAHPLRSLWDKGTRHLTKQDYYRKDSWKQGNAWEEAF
jgi:hypothetical protein